MEALYEQAAKTIRESTGLIALTGAGHSVESGIPDFRSPGGLWDKFNPMEYAHIDAFKKDPKKVWGMIFALKEITDNAQPNPGHKALARLEEIGFLKAVITQNVDNLHERAGSSNIIHLHGELFKSRSTVDENLVYDMEGWELNLGDTCEKGSQLRPHIVWFGEMVPMMDVAARETMKADIYLVVGTSLVVYPAAGLLDYVGSGIPKFIVDPNMPEVSNRPNLYLIEEKASTGMLKVRDILLSEYV